MGRLDRHSRVSNSNTDRANTRTMSRAKLCPENIHWRINWLLDESAEGNHVCARCLASFLTCQFINVWVRFCEWRCVSVRRLLWGFLFIFITEKSCSHIYVFPNMQSLWTTCRHRCRCLERRCLETALSVIPWVYYYTGGLSGPFGGLQVLFLRQQQMDCRTVQMKISELRSWKITTWTLCQVQPVYQQFELSGERGKHRLLSVWQHGKWLKFPCCIWVSHRGSFA